MVKGKTEKSENLLQAVFFHKEESIWSTRWVWYLNQLKEMNVDEIDFVWSCVSYYEALPGNIDLSGREIKYAVGLMTVAGWCVEILEEKGVDLEKLQEQDYHERYFNDCWSFVVEMISKWEQMVS